MGSPFCLDKSQPATPPSAAIREQASKGKGSPCLGALFVPMSGCRIFSVKDYCCAKPGERGHLVLLRPFPKVCFFVDLFRQRFSFFASPLRSLNFSRGYLVWYLRGQSAVWPRFSSYLFVSLALHGGQITLRASVFSSVSSVRSSEVVVCVSALVAVVGLVTARAWFFSFPNQRQQRARRWRSDGKWKRLGIITYSPHRCFIFCWRKQASLASLR